MATLRVSELGEYIRDQRRTAQISLRQLAKSAGVSNPYLSQIERGLRKPSAEILQQIAKALRISAEALYVQAGFLEERGEGSDVKAALLADGSITERQKQVLTEIYESFCKENALLRSAPEGATPTAPKVAAAKSAARATPKPTAKAPAARRTRTTSTTSTTSTTPRNSTTPKKS